MSGQLDQVGKAKTLANLSAANKGLPENSKYAVGSATGLEVLLPKYEISTARDGTNTVSQARIYLDPKANWEKGQLIPDVDTEGKSFVGFLLSSVQESRQEKVQTLPLHGDNYVATFFGENPRMYSFSGILYNTHFARWRDLFNRLYDRAFRGSALAKNRNLLHLVYDNKIISGWMMSLTQSVSAPTESMASFSFQFLVRSEVLLGDIRDLAYNNAYFTGAIPSVEVEGLEDLPDFDNYVNSARFRNPPKVQRGISKKKRAGCRPGVVLKQQDNQRKKTNPRKTGQNLRAGTPTKSSCDIREATLNVIRERDAEIEKAEKERDRRLAKAKNENQKESIRSQFRTRKSSLRNTAREELRTTYLMLKDTKGIKNKEDREQAETFKKELKLRTLETEDSFLSRMRGASATKDSVVLGRKNRLKTKKTTSNTSTSPATEARSN